MTADAPSASTVPAVVAPAAARLLSLSAGRVLALVVAFSTLLRLVPVLAKPTPTYFPDEFLYSDLARSLALDGRVALRGGSVTFPALLEPIVAAGPWLAGNVELAYQLTKGIHALAMSLAAVPAYLLVRRLGASSAWALAAAVFAVAGPNLVLSSFVTADALGYPLALAAIWLWLRVADGPTWGNQAWFIAAAGLAAFARVQYAVIFLAAACSALVLERVRVTALRRYPLVFLSIAAAFAVILLAGPARVLGAYVGLGSSELSLAELVSSTRTQVIGVTFACVVVLLPGAIAGVALGLVRPRSRAEAAFASLVVPLAAGLGAASVVVASSLPSDRFMERYLLLLPPVAFAAFVVSLQGERWTRVTAAVGSCGLALLVMRVPLTELTGGFGRTESQTLRAVGWLEEQLGRADASLALSVAALALCGLAAAVAARRAVAPLAVAAAIALAGAGALAGHVLDVRNARHIAATLLPGDPSWVDATDSGRVAFVSTRGDSVPRALEALFWNRSVREVVLLDGAGPLDQGVHLVGKILPDGRLAAGGRPPDRTLLVSSYASEVQLRGTRVVARHQSLALHRATGVIRVALAADRGWDGWLAADGTVRVWPASVPGVEAVLLRLHGPGPGRRATITLEAPGYQRSIRLEGLGDATVRIPVRGGAPWQLTFSTRPFRLLTGGRPVGVRAERLQLVVSDGRSSSSR